MKISKSGLTPSNRNRNRNHGLSAEGWEAALITATTLPNPGYPPRYNRTMAADAIRIERPTTNSKLFANTRWDAVPAAAGLFHLTYLFGLYFLFPHAPLWVMLVLGFVYSLMVNANINGVGHNFIHNPFFRSQLLNRLFGITQSIA